MSYDHEKIMGGWGRPMEPGALYIKVHPQNGDETEKDQVPRQAKVRYCQDQAETAAHYWI